MMGGLKVQGRGSAGTLQAGTGALEAALLVMVASALVGTVALGGWHGTGAPYLLVVPVWMLARHRGVRIAAPVAAGSTLVAWALWDAGAARHVNLAVLLAFAVVAGELSAARRASEGAEEPARALPARPPATPLTRREQDVLRLLATGHTNKEAAARLQLSVRTVESHRARIVGKLGCAGRSDLFRHARVLGLLDELEASGAPLAY
jgi:DNA-binding CsgD family transcriptional regulator